MDGAVLFLLGVLLLTLLVGLLCLVALREANKPRIIEAEARIEASKRARVMAERRWRIERGEEPEPDEGEESADPFWSGVESVLAARGVPVAQLRQMSPEALVAHFMARGGVPGGTEDATILK